MVKVKFNVDIVIYLDGINPTHFVPGQVADVSEGIASALFENGRASIPDEAKAEVAAAPENKMEAAAAPENKAAPMRRRKGK